MPHDCIKCGCPVYAGQPIIGDQYTGTHVFCDDPYMQKHERSILFKEGEMHFAYINDEGLPTTWR